MPWSREDRSFKTLINKETTDSQNKFFFNELGAKTINVHSSEIWSDTVALNNPAQAVIDGKAEQRSLFTLTEDLTVSGHQCWKTESPPGTRLLDWISDKYGANYNVHLFDNNNVEIYTTDTVGWFFDYQTGILSFNGDVSGKTRPFKITGYRYIGAKGSGGGGSGVIIYATESALMLATPADSTIGYATDTKHFFERANSQWVPVGGLGALTYPAEADLLADTPELASIWAAFQPDLFLLTPPAGTIGVALDAVPSIYDYTEYGLLRTASVDGTIGVALNKFTDARAMPEAILLSMSFTEKTLGVGTDTQNFWLRGTSSWLAYAGAAIYYTLYSDLIADTPANGTVGYAEDDDSFWYRYNGAWSSYVFQPAYWQRVSSAWVPYTGSGLFYDTDVALHAASPANGTVGFAIDTELFYFRRSSIWKTTASDPTFWLRGASSWSAYTGSSAFYDTEVALLAASPVDGTVAFPLDTSIFHYRRRAVWFLSRNDSRFGIAEAESSPWFSVGATWKNIFQTLLEASGPTYLTMSSVADGKFLKRSGTYIIGADPAGGGVTIYATEVALLAATPANGSIGYATNTKNFWWRKNNQWRAAETSTGPNQVCIGPGAINSVSDAVSIGAGSSALANKTIVIGSTAEARAGCDNSIVIGYSSIAANGAIAGVAIGNDATVSVGYNCTAVGSNSNATGNSSSAFGIQASAGNYAIAISNSIAYGNYSISIGYSAQQAINVTNSILIGSYAQIYGFATTYTTGAISIGPSSLVGDRASYAIAIGHGATVSGYMGSYVGDESIAIGHSANVQHQRAGAIGNDAASTANDRITIGKVGGSATQIKALQVSGAFGMAGAVPTAQRTHVANPSGGAVTDVEARAAINSILASLEAIGLHATV